MAQINFSAEEQMNMNKQELANAQEILRKYINKTESAASKKRWSDASKKIGNSMKTLESCIAQAKKAGIQFKDGEESILTIAEVGKRMREHLAKQGKSVDTDAHALGIEDISLSNSLGDRARDLMNDPNASQKISTGIMAFAAAEFAFSALGMGGALGAGTSLLTSVLPLIGDGIAALWGCSPVGVMALGVGLFIKAYPFLKKMKAKITQQQTRNLQRDLESIRGDKGSEKDDGPFKVIENAKEEPKKEEPKKEEPKKEEPKKEEPKKEEPKKEEPKKEEPKKEEPKKEEPKKEEPKKEEPKKEEPKKEEPKKEEPKKEEPKKEEPKKEEPKKEEPKQELSEVDKMLAIVEEMLGKDSLHFKEIEEAVKTVRQNMSEAQQISTTLTESLPPEGKTIGYKQNPENCVFKQEDQTYYLDEACTQPAKMTIEECEQYRDSVNAPKAKKEKDCQDKIVLKAGAALDTIRQIGASFHASFNVPTDTEKAISNLLTALNIEQQKVVAAINKNQAEADTLFAEFNAEMDACIQELQAELDAAKKQDTPEEPVPDDEEPAPEDDKKVEELPPTVSQALKGFGDKLLTYLTSNPKKSQNANNVTKYVSVSEIDKVMGNPDKNIPANPAALAEILGMTPEELETAPEAYDLATNVFAAYAKSLRGKTKNNQTGKAAHFQAKKVVEEAVKAAEEAEQGGPQG